MDTSSQSDEYMRSHIREIEQNILDKYYRNYDVLLWKDDYIIPYLLKCWGDVARELKGPEFDKHSAFVLRRQINMYVQSLGWCIKWTSQHQAIKSKSKLSNKILSKKCLEALQWGIQYHILVQNHVAWSRGHMDAEIDAIEKKIIFQPPDLKIFQFILGQELDSENVFDNLYSAIPILEISEYYHKRRGEIDWNNPPIEFDWRKAKTESIFLIVLKWIERTILPELDNSLNLGNYTLEDLRRLFAGIFIHATLICFAEDEVDERMGYTNPFGSNPICFPRKTVVLLLFQWSGVPEVIIDAILDDFIFDIDNFHSSLTNQPFVRTKNGSLLMLPRLFVHTEFNRLISGALNKKSKKSIYDNIINVIEKTNLDALQTLFSNSRLIAFKELSFKTKSQKITPDFILIDENSKSIFIVDYKHFLIPLNANETLFKLSEVKKGIKKIDSYRSFIMNNPGALKVHYPKYDETYSITPLLLCKWPIPVPISIEEEIRVLTVSQIKKILADKSNSLKAGIETFYENIIKAVEEKTNNLRIIEEIISVGEWSYSRYIYAG